MTESSLSSITELNSRLNEQIVKKKFSVLWLFLTFVRIGCLTFGGGWNVIVQAKKIFVDEEACFTEQELADISNVSRSLPGIVVCNLSFMLGYRLRGVPGGLACTLGMGLGPLAILSAVTYSYAEFRDSRIVSAAMGGVRASIVPIILSSIPLLSSGAFKHKLCYAVLALCFALYFFFDVNCVLVILLGAVLGLCITVRGAERSAEGK